MNTPPSAPYSGLTVMLDRPSRLDNTHLLTGTARDWFADDCLVAGHTLASIDVRDLACTLPVLPNTRKLALLGPKCAQKFGGSLGQHGYPLWLKDGIHAVASFDPQECNDHRTVTFDKDSDDDDDDDGDNKDSAPTRRKNWRFWTRWHMNKLCSWPIPEYQPMLPYVNPPLEEICRILDETHDQFLYLDIETSRINNCLLCIGFSTSSRWPAIYVVPIYRAAGTLAHLSIAKLYRSFARAFLRNTVVAHNGEGFDFFVLRCFYKFPWPIRVYDTMIANHRCFPESEKSLAHVIAQWTFLPYHKDEIVDPYNYKQEQQLWHYNAKDVYTMKLVHDMQAEYVARDVGLQASIQQAMDSIIPYNDMTRVGMEINMPRLAVKADKLKVERDFWGRIARILVGKEFNPGSSDQCRKYFFDKLNYEPLEKTKDGKSKIGSKQLYQLQLKYRNPLIPVVLKYREAAKDLSMLECERWENNT